MFDSISMLPKVNNSCFLDCDYCMVVRELELEKKGKLPSTMMPLSTIEKMCDMAIGYNKWFFSYVGGEPLMNGKDYFREMFQIIERKSKEYYTPYTHRVTTNGLMLDDEWIELFAKYNCKIIFSYDGYGYGKKGSKKAQDLIRKYAKDIHVVQAVIGPNNCANFLDIYKELEELGARRMNTQYEIYSPEEEYLRFAEGSLEVFKYIDSLEKVKTSLFLYNDAKAIAAGKLASINGGEFINSRLLADYVIDYDGEIRNALNSRESDYAKYGNINTYTHFNDLLTTETTKYVLKDYVNAMRAFGELKEVALVTRGGGYPGDRFGIRREDAPHVPKLRCFKILLEHFGMKL